MTVADRLVLSHAPRPNRERTHRRLLAAISKAQPNAGPPLRKGLPVGKLGGAVLADALDSKVNRRYRLFCPKQSMIVGA